MSGAAQSSYDVSAAHRATQNVRELEGDLQQANHDLDLYSHRYVTEMDTLGVQYRVAAVRLSPIEVDTLAHAFSICRATKERGERSS